MYDTEGSVEFLVVIVRVEVRQGSEVLYGSTLRRGKRYI